MRYSIKNLLRGLGISELPKILTTHFFKEFYYTLMLHPKTDEVKQNCKKMRQAKVFLKNGEKRRYTG